MSDRAAIVLVTTSFPRSGDGSEAAGGFVADLAEALAQHCPVRVVAPGEDAGKDPASGNVEVFRYQAPARPLSTLRPWNPSDLATIFKVWRSGRDATMRAVRAGPTRRILALWALPSGGWARSAALKASIPYDVWTLGSDIWSYGRIPGFKAWLRRVLGGADRVYSDGLQLGRDTQQIAGREVQFLASTRDMQERGRPESRVSPPYRLVFLGRWHPNKGVDLLLQALDELGPHDWRRIEQLEIFGGGPLEGLVKAKVHQLRQAGLPVLLGGYLDKEGASIAVSQADWLLIPSRIESIPVVFSDAIKLGVPVITMPVGDLPALVSRAPACGLVASHVTASAFAEALQSALDSAPGQFMAGVADRKGLFDLGVICRQLLAVGRGG